MRDTFHLRYALEPYIYTEARRTYDTGVAFLRPLYYDWPEQDAAYTTKNEYVFGSDMLVAPVTTPVDPATQLAKESIWIPEGQWFERATGRTLSGPRMIDHIFSIDQIPVYIKAGAIVPMQPAMRYTGEKPVDPLIVNVYPLSDGQSSNYKLYEDSGDSEAYKHGICAWTRLSAHQAGDTLTVDVDPVEGSYPGMLTQRGYEIRLPADWPPETVTVNGANIAAGKNGWSYEGNTLTTVIHVPGASVHEKVHIEIHRAVGSLAARAQLEGFAGSITRLNAAYDALNSLWPFTWSSQALIKALQTGDRLYYRPQTAREELAKFPKLYAQALDDVQTLASQANIPDDELAKRLMQNRGADTAMDRARRYKSTLHRALVLLQDGQTEQQAAAK
jgi:hypothetical protein